MNIEEFARETSEQTCASYAYVKASIERMIASGLSTEMAIDLYKECRGDGDYIFSAMSLINQPVKIKKEGILKRIIQKAAKFIKNVFRKNGGSGD